MINRSMKLVQVIFHAIFCGLSNIFLKNPYFRIFETSLYDVKSRRDSMFMAATNSNRLL